jgi:hypothetical protein
VGEWQKNLSLHFILIGKTVYLAIFMCQLSENPGSLNILKPSGPVYACMEIALPFFL